MNHDTSKSQKGKNYTGRLVGEVLTYKVLSKVGNGVAIIQDDLIKYANISLAEMVGCPVKQLNNSYYTDYFHFNDSEDLSPGKRELNLGSGNEQIKVESTVEEISYGGRKALLVIIQGNASFKPKEGIESNETGYPEDSRFNQKLEEPLQDSEVNFRGLFESAAVGIAIVGFEGRPWRCNSALERLLGYREEELSRMCFTEFTHPDDAWKDWSFFQELKQGKREGYKTEKRFIRKDGGIIWALLSVFVLRNEYGKPLFVYGMVEDITERKRAEKALKNSEEKYRSLAENVSDCVFVHDLNFNLEYVTPSVENILGYTPEEAYKLAVEDIMTPESSKRARECLHEEVKKARENNVLIFYPGEYEYVRKDGRTFWGELTAKFLCDSNGDITSLQVIMRDIDQRKRTEWALQESEELYRSLIRTSPDPVVVTDLQGNIQEVSQQALELWGGKTDDLLERNVIELVSDEDKKKARANLKETLKKGFKRNTEYNIVRENGTIFVGETNSTLFKDHNGDPRGIIFIVRDVTERRNAEEKMKRQLMKFKLSEGNLYLIKEDSPTLSMEVMKDLCSINHRVLVISRTPEKELKKNIKGNFDFLWLGESGDKVIPPDLDEIESFVSGLERKKVVLLDRLDYLISKNDFKKILSFVQRLRDIAYFNELFMIISTDPTNLSEDQLKLLEKETMEIASQHQGDVSRDLLAILKYVYNQNNIGVKPTYTDIRKAFSISKPTLQKKLDSLISKGYITTNTKGRCKFVELTEKGWHLFYGQLKS